MSKPFITVGDRIQKADHTSILTVASVNESYITVKERFGKITLAELADGTWTVFNPIPIPKARKPMDGDVVRIQGEKVDHAVWTVKNGIVTFNDGRACYESSLSYRDEGSFNWFLPAGEKIYEAPKLVQGSTVVVMYTGFGPLTVESVVGDQVYFTNQTRCFIGDVTFFQRWQMKASQLRQIETKVGDTVIVHGPKGNNLVWKVWKFDNTDKQVTFTNGRTFSLSALNFREGNWHLPMDRVPEGRHPASPVVGDLVFCGSYCYTIERVTSSKVYFHDGKYSFIGNIDFDEGFTVKAVHIRTAEKKSEFTEPPAGLRFYLCAQKDADDLNRQVHYMSSKGFKLWGSTLVKGDHYAQAMRKE